jgi:hypothetical protein
MLRYLLLLIPALAWAQSSPLMVPNTEPIPAVAVGAATGQATWFMVRSFNVPPYGGRYCIEDRNDAGKWMDTCINPGTMVGTPGAEQGDMDFDILVDGKPANISVAGRWAQNPPGLQVWPPDLMWIGSVSNRWAGIYMTSVPCPASVPGRPAYCVRNSGGFTPVYQ